MFEHILIPLDRSALAECVLPHVSALAHVFDSRVTLLHVIDAPRPADILGPVNPLGWQLQRAEAEGYLLHIAQRLEAEGIPVNQRLAEGAAAEQILEVAHTDRVDLIVCSSHGQSGLTSWNISSVVQKVASRAYTSLMIVRANQHSLALPGAGNPCVRYERVLVPMDGSQRAEYVLPAAARLAAQGARILLAHVVHRPEMPRRTPLTRADSELSERYIESNRAEAEQYLSEVCNRLPGDVEMRIIVSDHVSRTLHDLARQEAVDLVLASAHGYSGQSCWPFGSVVGSFITFGQTPLLIVQDAQRPANGAYRSFVVEPVTRQLGRLRVASASARVERM